MGGTQQAPVGLEHDMKKLERMARKVRAVAAAVAGAAQALVAVMDVVLQRTVDAVAQEGEE